MLLKWSTLIKITKLAGHHESHVTLLRRLIDIERIMTSM